MGVWEPFHPRDQHLAHVSQFVLSVSVWVLFLGMFLHLLDLHQLHSPFPPFFLLLSFLNLRFVVAIVGQRPQADASAFYFFAPEKEVCPTNVPRKTNSA